VGVAERVDGLQRQGHHGDLSAVQQSGDLQAGGAAVEQDGLAVRDEPGDLGGDPALGVDSLVGAQREGRLIAPQQQGARPAAESFEDALRGEGVLATLVCFVLDGTFMGMWPVQIHSSSSGAGRDPGPEHRFE
jgi:hypothetical protein